MPPNVVVLAVNANGYLNRVTDPAGQSVALSYGVGGLLTSLTEPRGAVHRFTYDAKGLLTRDEDPAGGFTALGRVEISAGRSVVTTTTAMALNRSYRVENLDTGGEQRVITLPTGATMTDTIGYLHRSGAPGFRRPG